MALETRQSIELPPLDFSGGVSVDETDHHRCMNALLSNSEWLPEDEIVGGVIKFQVADGYAFYMVVDDDPLMVAHVAYGDNWRAPDVLIRGLDLNDVREALDRQRRLKVLFSRG